MHSIKAHSVWPCLLAVALFGACQREGQVAVAPEADPAATALHEARGKLNESQDTVAAQLEQLAATTAALRSANRELAEKDQLLAQRDLLLQTASAELETLKKSEALVFAEICGLQQQGQNVIAVSRFRKFAADFPRSPLASHAARAVADLTDATAREVQQRADRLEAQRQERDSKRLLDDGLLTLQELAPLLRKRTKAQVLALLGNPSRVFPEGSEIGYLDRVSSASGGRKGMLIITFDASVVSALRMDYAGPKLTP